MFLTLDQIQDLLEVIEKNHIVFIGNNIGSSVLTKRDKRILSDWGVSLKDFPETGKIDEMYKFGILSDVLGDDKAKAMTYDELKSFLSSGSFIPLNSSDKFSLIFLKNRMYSDIKRLGSKVSGVLSDMMQDSVRDRRIEYENIIRNTASDTIINRKSLASMKSLIGEKTGDWSRDLDRVVDTVMHEAFNTGRIQSIRKKHGDDAEIWMQVYPGACKHCVSFYLTNGYGSEPIKYKIKDILKNGTNFHRKQPDWKAVLPPAHPYCRCTSFHYETGYIWDEEKQIFVPPVYTTQRKSRVKITIEE